MRAGVADAVTFTGWVDDRTLDAIYAGAEVFVYPSLCEGFGLPLLEAMERGVPVLSSRATSLPEVGGDAVEYVDAARVPELAASLLRRLEDRPAGRSSSRRACASMRDSRGGAPPPRRSRATSARSAGRRARRREAEGR